MGRNPLLNAVVISSWKLEEYGLIYLSQFFVMSGGSAKKVLNTISILGGYLFDCVFVYFFAL